MQPTTGYALQSSPQPAIDGAANNENHLAEGSDMCKTSEVTEHSSMIEFC
jgi:hypothetical protein